MYLITQENKEKMRRNTVK